MGRKIIGTSLSDLNKLVPDNNIEDKQKKVDSKNKKESKNKESKIYANTPYNFIEFPDKVVYRYNNIEELPKHNIFERELNTGYIEYTIRNLTPLFIGSGLGQIDSFFKVKGRDGEESYVIPGSAIKGRVRSNAEVLSFSYPQFIEERKFLYRDIAGETISKEEYYKSLDLNGENIDISDKLRAGYLYKENNNYYIQPAKEICGKNFYKVKEEFLIKPLNMGWNRFSGYNTMYFYKKENKKFKAIESSRYRPYETPLNINFNLNNNAGISKICPIERENLSYKGKLYNSNYIKGKKNHYVINEPNRIEKAIKVPDYLIHQFEKDYKDNKIKNSFYYLPKNNEKKVIFYKMENEKLKYFGRTPYLRIFYQNSIREILNDTILVEKDIFDKNNKNLKYKIDYAEALFGFINKILKIKEENGEKKDKTISYKGRVDFTDLKKEEGQVLKCLSSYNKQIESKEFILGTPKPTSFQLYLKQDKTDNKQLTTYNNFKEERIDPKLRGQKFYWQRNKVEKTQEAEKNNMKKNFKSIENGKFSGKIYFENLNDDELGLLLLSLNYNKNTTDNIGLAKSFGYGKIKVDDIKLIIEDKKKSFQSFFEKQKENVASNQKLNKLKCKFKIEFLNRYNEEGKDKMDSYDNIDIIKQYEISKKDYKGNEKLDYMDIKEFKYRKPLKDINDYI